MSRRSRPPAKPRPSRGADLHVHTTRSDGHCSPGEVVRAAAEVGLCGVAITDHDTTRGIASGSSEAARLGIELIAGVELSAIDQGRELHILGYFVDPDDSRLVEQTESLCRARNDRFLEMITRLRKLGFKLDYDDLSKWFPRAALGRRHLAETLVRSGQVPTRRLVFDRLLGDNGPAFVPKPLLGGADSIQLIREAGGVAGLAHPPRYLGINQIAGLREQGLSALEIDGPGVDNRERRRRTLIVDELGLIPTAGSDFHAPDRSGSWVGAVTTPESDLERLRQAVIGSSVAKVSE